MWQRKNERITIHALVLPFIPSRQDILLLATKTYFPNKRQPWWYTLRPPYAFLSRPARSNPLAKTSSILLLPSRVSLLRLGKATPLKFDHSASSQLSLTLLEAGRSVPADLSFPPQFSASGLHAVTLRAIRRFYAPLHHLPLIIWIPRSLLGRLFTGGGGRIIVGDREHCFVGVALGQQVCLL